MAISAHSYDRSKPLQSPCPIAELDKMCSNSMEALPGPSGRRVALGGGCRVIYIGDVVHPSLLSVLRTLALSTRARTRRARVLTKIANQIQQILIHLLCCTCIVCRIALRCRQYPSCARKGLCKRPTFSASSILSTSNPRPNLARNLLSRPASSSSTFNSF